MHVGIFRVPEMRKVVWKVKTLKLKVKKSCCECAGQKIKRQFQHASSSQNTRSGSKQRGVTGYVNRSETDSLNVDVFRVSCYRLISTKDGQESSSVFQFRWDKRLATAVRYQSPGRPTTDVNLFKACRTLDSSEITAGWNITSELTRADK